MNDWSEEARDLIALGKEGDYWDYKREHHADVGALIKDIVCLANNVRHTGSRYIFFGVSDDGDVTGVPNKNRRTQAQIVDALSNARFANGSFPSIYSRELEIDDQLVDVLIIEDLPEKPYFVDSNYGKGRPTLQAGTVYSRVRDRNTASDSTASVADLERMWRERFGLDRTPYERVFNYLAEPDDWVSSEENHWHHSMHPEFTVVPTPDELWEVTGSESWVRAATNPRSFVRPLRLCYHQTVLAHRACIYYDEMRGLVPAPSGTQTYDPDDRFFYSITGGTLDFQLLLFLTKQSLDELIHIGFGYSRGRRMPVAIFRSRIEQERFADSLSERPIQDAEMKKVEEQRPFHQNVADHDKDVIQYTWAVLVRLYHWRRDEQS